MQGAMVVAAALLVAASGAQAQDHAQHSAHAGKEGRAIKALSEQEVADLLAGEGMGLALAAELNGYPGPRHVLDHARELGLSAEQEEQVRSIFAAMERDAMALGERIVAAERRLDALFGERAITATELAATLAGIGRLQGELRLVHLRAHLETTSQLTPQQVRHYDVVRGYRTGHGPDH